ncbi:MAG: hypothetical protein VB138_03525, partial [Burkholderia sp.]
RRATAIPRFTHSCACSEGRANGPLTINTIAQFGGLVGLWSIGLVRNATGNFKLALLTIAAFLAVATVIALLMRLKPAGGDGASLHAADRAAHT